MDPEGSTLPTKVRCSHCNKNVAPSTEYRRRMGQAPVRLDAAALANGHLWSTGRRATKRRRVEAPSECEMTGQNVEGEGEGEGEGGREHASVGFGAGGEDGHELWPENPSAGTHCHFCVGFPYLIQLLPAMDMCFGA